jgi:hypothetical protein
MPVFKFGKELAGRTVPSFLRIVEVLTNFLFGVGLRGKVEQARVRAPD